MEEGAIVDGENYRNLNEGMGFKEICMAQLQRVVINSSKEMRAGFFVYTPPSGSYSGGQKQKYFGDTRKELKQSIDVLHDLLLPKFDEEMQKQSKLIIKEFDEWHDTWKNKEIAKNQEENYWSRTLKIYRKLFQQLCYFLERMGWLESVGIEE